MKERLRCEHKSELNMFIKEFLGLSGADGVSYWREAEGAYSWQHLTFVTSLLVVMAVLAAFLGRAYNGKSESEKNRVLIWAAILIDAFELFKIAVLCGKSADDPTVGRPCCRCFCAASSCLLFRWQHLPKVA